MPPPPLSKTRTDPLVVLVDREDPDASSRRPVVRERDTQHGLALVGRTEDEGEVAETRAARGVLVERSKSRRDVDGRSLSGQAIEHLDRSHRRAWCLL